MSLTKILAAAHDGGTGPAINGLAKIRRAAAEYLDRPADPWCRKIMAARREAQEPVQMDGLLKVRLAAGLGRPDKLISKAAGLVPQVDELHRLLADAHSGSGERQRRLLARRKVEVAAAAARQAAHDARIQQPCRRAYPFHPHDAPLSYFRCRDRLSSEISAGTVMCTPEVLVARIGELARVTPDVAAEWTERFLADMERHIECRRRKVVARTTPTVRTPSRASP